MGRAKKATPAPPKKEPSGMNLRLPPKLYQRLRTMNYETDEAMSDFIRRAVDKALTEAKF